MKAIQIVVDEELLARLDKTARKQRISRSAFVRRSLEAVLEAERIRDLVEQERRAYAKKPVSAEERAAVKALGRGQRRVLEDLDDEGGW